MTELMTRAKICRKSDVVMSGVASQDTCVSIAAAPLARSGEPLARYRYCS